MPYICESGMPRSHLQTLHPLDATVSFSNHSLSVKTRADLQFVCNNISQRTHLLNLKSLLKAGEHKKELYPGWMVYEGDRHSMPILCQKNKTYFDCNGDCFSEFDSYPSAQRPCLLAGVLEVLVEVSTALIFRKKRQFHQTFSSFCVLHYHII